MQEICVTPITVGHYGKHKKKKLASFLLKQKVSTEKFQQEQYFLLHEGKHQHLLLFKKRNQCLEGYDMVTWQPRLEGLSV